MSIYIEFIKAWFNIGAFTFGGGYAMLPLMQKELVEKRHWVTDEELLDYFAIGQCTPGVIAVNTASFVGYKLKGIPGAIVSTISIILPSFIIINIIAKFIEMFADNIYVLHALNGIRIAVCVLMTVSLTKMAKKSVKNYFHVAIVLITFIATYFFDISTVTMLVVIMVIALAIYALKERHHE